MSDIKPGKNYSPYSESVIFLGGYLVSINVHEFLGRNGSSFITGVETILMFGYCFLFFREQEKLLYIVYSTIFPLITFFCIILLSVCFHVCSLLTIQISVCLPFIFLLRLLFFIGFSLTIIYECMLLFVIFRHHNIFLITCLVCFLISSVVYPKFLWTAKFSCFFLG